MAPMFKHWLLEQMPRYGGADECHRQRDDEIGPPYPEIGKQIAVGLLDRIAVDVDSVRIVADPAEDRARRVAQPQPDSQISDRQAGDISGIVIAEAEESQHGARHAQTAAQWQPV